jgi:hypothetical protein
MINKATLDRLFLFTKTHKFEIAELNYKRKKKKKKFKIFSNPFTHLLVSGFFTYYFSGVFQMLWGCDRGIWVMIIVLFILFLRRLIYASRV